MRLLVALIILTLIACAALSAHSHKPFPLLVDAAKPMGEAKANLLIAPCPLTPQNIPILSAERTT